MKEILVIESNDGITSKYVFETYDGYQIEGVYVNYDNKHIICYSTQIGCRGGCKFCINGIKNKFIRNLTSEEMTEECIRIYEKISDPSSKPVLFSAMGIGDSMDNYENYIKHIHDIQFKYSETITVKFATSTLLSNPDILELLARDIADIENFKLQISLHSMILKEVNRNGNNYKSIVESELITYVLESIWEYIIRTKRDVDFNYVMIKDLTDFPEYVRYIGYLFEIFDLEAWEHIVVKLNKFNRIEGSELKPSDQSKIDLFKIELTDFCIRNEYYETDGSDIGGACGQLTSNNK